MAKYKMRQDRVGRKPLPECLLTSEEWDGLWQELNDALSSEDELRYSDAKKSVREQLRIIYTERGNKGHCVLCGDECGRSGLCKRCWRALTNSGLLRSEGHTLARDNQEEESTCCAVCGADKVLCKNLCAACYSIMRSHGLTSAAQVYAYRWRKKHKRIRG